MKRTTWLIFLILGILQVVVAQKKVSIYDLDEFNGVTYQVNHNEPFTGIGEETYANGKKWRHIPFKDGRAEGVAKEWDQEGKLVTEVEYRMGVRNGRETQYFPNGKKRLEVFYQNDQPQGTITEWYKDGTLQSRGEVLNGEFYGKHTWWFPSGQIDQEMTYRSGVVEGKVTNYFEDGTIRKTAEFQRGVLHGKTVEWYAEGRQLMREQNFWEGAEHGESKFWAKDGRLLEKKTYERGNLLKAEDYNSASIKTPKGYTYVFNLLNANFILHLEGEKVEPIGKERLAFFVDGTLVQFFTTPISDFKKEGETLEKSELWQRFLNDERNRVEFQLDTTIEVQQKPFSVSSVSDEGVLWWFDLPVEIVNGKLKIVQEQYLSLICKGYILEINGLVLSANDPQTIEAKLKTIAETLEFRDAPIDIIGYSKSLIRE